MATHENVRRRRGGALVMGSRPLGNPPLSLPARSDLTLEPRWRPHAAGLFFQWPPPDSGDEHQGGDGVAVKVVLSCVPTVIAPMITTEMSAAMLHTRWRSRRLYLKGTSRASISLREASCSTRSPLFGPAGPCKASLASNSNANCSVCAP
jgi:hypothetical protein